MSTTWRCSSSAAEWFFSPAAPPTFPRGAGGAPFYRQGVIGHGRQTDDYILTIAQEGGISKAAAKLFITQSALDQQLLKLEHELGTRLFFRSRSSFALTEAGRVYVEYARRMLELKNEAYRIIHDIAGRRRGTLSLAFAPERGMEMFMAVYPRFYQSYPEVTVTPREISVRRQLEMLAGDELDLGFISRPEGTFRG